MNTDGLRNKAKNKAQNPNQSIPIPQDPAPQNPEQQYAVENNIEGLTSITLRKIIAGEFNQDRAAPFLRFQKRINLELLNHRVITHNAYTKWFEEGNINSDQVKHFLIQFSVFSNQFLIAQLHKMLNAETLEEMRASKEILANEIGVIFNNKGSGSTNNSPKEKEGQALAILDGMDGSEIVGLEGTVDGGSFRFKAAHFEWLVSLAQKLNLDFQDMGRRCHGDTKTLYFCDELIRLYGSEQYSIASAASYAVENWAAAGFWDELVSGLAGFKENNKIEDFPLAFFTWHSKLEANHAHHTQQEIEEYYFTNTVDEDSFLKYGNEMLDGVEAFWDGLNQSRQGLH